MSATRSNKAFLGYFSERVGYTLDWETDGKARADLVPSVLERCREPYAHDMSRMIDVYVKLKTDIFLLSAEQRQRCIHTIEEKCKSLNTTEPNIARNYVASHDMLIGAEIECYLQSNAGKKSLRELHEVSLRS